MITTPLSASLLPEQRRSKDCNAPQWKGTAESRKGRAKHREVMQWQSSAKRGHGIAQTSTPELWRRVDSFRGGTAMRGADKPRNSKVTKCLAKELQRYEWLCGGNARRCKARRRDGMARQGGATARRSKERTCGGVEMICLAEDTQGHEQRRHRVGTHGFAREKRGKERYGHGSA